MPEDPHDEQASSDPAATGPAIGAAATQPTEPMLELVAELGDALNRSSYPTPRARDILVEVSHEYKDDITVEVFPTLVFGMNQRSHDLAISKTGPAFRFDQMADTQTLIQKLRSHAIKPVDALNELRQISSSKPPFHAWVRVFGYTLQALGFAQLFRMSLHATVLATLLGAVVGMLLLWSSLKGTLASLMPVLMTFVSALVISVAAVAGDSSDPVRTAVVPVLILIPGAALTCALIELTGGDMIAGAARLVYATFILISMAFGFALAVALAKVPSSALQDLPSAQSAWYWPWFAVLIFAIGNVMYFCTPKRLWLPLVAVAFLSYAASQVLTPVLGSAFATGVSAGVGLILAMLFNRESDIGPSTMVLYLPTFWMLVPGSMGFVALSGVITHNRTLSDMGTQTAVSIMSMAVCIMIVSIVAPAFTSSRKRVVKRVAETSAERRKKKGK